MAFRTQKISQMTPKGANLEATDLIEVSTIESGSYVTRSITGQEIIDGIPPAAAAWGSITGTLSSQTDLQSALNAKQDTLTLTTTGTSGAATLVGSTLNIPQYSGGASGITIGTTAIASGTVGRILFDGTGNVVQESGNLFWDNTNNRLGIGTSSPSFGLDVNGTARVQDNLTVVKNQNTSTIISISNTNNTASSEVSYNLTSSNGTASFAKKSASGSVYKTISGNDAYIYNGTSGDISILNDTTGRIKFAAGGASTAQMTLFSTGNVLINTTTDAGFRLDVNGTARVKGTGTTSATTAFRIENSAGTEMFRVYDNTGIVGLGARFGDVSIGSYAFHGTNVKEISVNGGSLILQATQGTGVVIGAITLLASAQLQLDSTTKGFLPPRMTTTQKNAIASPAAGLMVYDTTLNVISYYNGTMWV